MAVINDQQEGTSTIGTTSKKINWMHVRAETTSCFGGLALDIVNGSGVRTTYYYWPNTSGVLRYGTTAPTTSTQDSAGSAV